MRNEVEGACTLESGGEVLPAAALERFLDETAVVDLEINARGEIYAIGALLGGREFHRRGRLGSDVLHALDTFCAPAQRLLGHNVLHHDLPHLRNHLVALELYHKPVIDTLYLSPLAFPQNPYHKLVKEYKLVRDSLSDPLADARLTAELLRDQWNVFAQQQVESPQRLALIRYCLESDRMGAGLVALFAALGVAQIGAAEAYRNLREQWAGEVCSSRFDAVVRRYLPDREQRIALAYCAAWLGVAGGNSVLPGWVRHQFPAVALILHQLRDIPCGSAQCHYCCQVHHPEGQLQRYFGFAAFRPQPLDPATGESLQRRIVADAMGEQSLLAILPTGGGKSLCYQLPALIRYQRRGLLTLIISPLQALMKDQVDNLRHKSGAHHVGALYGLLTPPERGQILEQVRMGDIALLYLSPEQLRNHSLNRVISQREIGCWVFDEAHCLSKWGHDFRPDYLYAGRRIREIAQQQGVPIPPVQCFTATAKRDVAEEIAAYFRTTLGLELTLYRAEVQRDNLCFAVEPVAEMARSGWIHALLQERLVEGVALIYCATRKKCEDLAATLGSQGWSVAVFHAGLEAPRKREILEAFMANRVQVICATNAFGMGIDKEDVRLVIHADIPGSLENYLQEAGRAGRDQRTAECILLYDEADVEVQFRLGGRSQLRHRDIVAILRGIRAARRKGDQEVVLTTGELLRSQALTGHFDPYDTRADTKVRSAVAWLERAGFVEQNQNYTQIFQGRPLVHSLEEAQRKVERCNLSQQQQQRWLAILQWLLNSSPDTGFSADDLAELAPFHATPEEVKGRLTPGQQVLRTLHDMAGQGLISKSMQLTAFVHREAKGHSRGRLAAVIILEKALFEALRETAPDAEGGEWHELSLRHLNQQLLNSGHESLPQRLRDLLYSLAQDGRGLAGGQGSIALRYSRRDHYQLRLLRRSWRALVETAELRNAVAQVIVEQLLRKIPKDTKGSNLMVAFAMEDILRALQQDLLLRARLRDPLAAVERALNFLHEQKVIILQQGLAVFHAAMTIRILPERKGQGYRLQHYQPLANHYLEKIFQLHVMNQYAQLGTLKISQALRLVTAYFSEDKQSFIQRYFPNNQEMLTRAISDSAYRKIVEQLNNPQQQDIVTAPTERNLLILAGPGAGKSRVVVHRCAWLLQVQRQPPESILLLSFNRNAADELARRLDRLVGGGGSRRVTVQTYHGLAMRLLGRSLVDAEQQQIDFDQLLDQAAELLEGKHEILGIESDELRERLLAGFRYILVDEYQDINERQYRLVSAIAGRTQQDPERRLSILAVGDDDQNIYEFNGTNVEFIRRFARDYQAETCYLVENYRSTAYIIAAANQLIAANRDRMKAEQPIQRNRSRRHDSPGGRWQQQPAMFDGRVQCLQVRDGYHQARAVVDEWHRLKQLDPQLVGRDCAVLARTWRQLDALRILLASEGVEVSYALPSKQYPSPLRIREHRHLLDWLKCQRGKQISASQALQQLAPAARNPWWGNLHGILAQWQRQSGDLPQPAIHLESYLYEALNDQRSQQRLGDGIFLSTIHSVKGMEFRHLWLLDGDWNSANESERRLCYVALSRACETLYILCRNDGDNPFIGQLQGDFLITRHAPVDNSYPAALKGLRREFLGSAAFDLGYAGSHPPHHPIHAALRTVESGTRLSPGRNGNRLLLLHQQIPIARLANHREPGQPGAELCNHWQGVESVEVIAMLQRTKDDEKDGYRQRCQAERWELPIVEITYRLEIGHQ